MDMVNFAVFHQPKEDIQTLQQQQKAYYFSAAFNVVLEKHGLLSIRCQTPDVGNAAPGFVCREMSLPPDLLSCPLVMEGPLHEATLRALGVQATQKSTHQLQITGQDLETIQILGYSQFTVRKIPRERQAAQAPFPFVSEDDLWNRDRFYYQILSVPDGWEAVLMAVSETEPTPVPVAITNGQHRFRCGMILTDLIRWMRSHPALTSTDSSTFAPLGFGYKRPSTSSKLTTSAQPPTKSLCILLRQTKLYSKQKLISLKTLAIS